MNKIFLKINSENANNRIDKILAGLDKIIELNITRGQIKKFIDNGFLLKNNEKLFDNSYIAKIGDEFSLNLPNIVEKSLKTADIPLNIVYEDDDLLVINKQAGLTTHPGAGNDDNTLVNALLKIYGNNLSKVGGEFRPGIIHRLDKDTSGLMVVAKNDSAHLKLSEQLQKRNLKRTYAAFLWGVLTPKNGSIAGYMQRSRTNRLKMEMTKNENARYSLTNYKTLETFANNSLSFVEFELDTGRTHQIRLHCSSKNCPLVGDHLYGGTSRHMKKEYLSIKDIVDNFPRQALHSYKIKFYQPTTNKLLKFEIPLPDDMNILYAQLKKFKDK